MAWIKTVNGPINLDNIMKIVVQANGDAYFYSDSVNYVSVSIASTQADGKKIVERITAAVNPADYA